MSKLLLDTNLLFYTIDQSSSFHAATTTFLDETENELYTTSKNISEFLVATTRGDSPTLTPEQALNAVDGFRQFITVLYSTEDTFDQFNTLMQKYQPKGKKIHDYEIASIALANGINQIATYNTSDFAGITEITVVTPLS
jgi:predicted nucleic acid-binding protein